MQEPSKMSRTAVLVETALMVAMAFVLSYVKVFEAPLGGSVTLCATLPLLVLSLRHNIRWSVAAAAVFGVLQAVQGLHNILYVKTLPLMIGVFLLDYFLAYFCLGFAGPIARRFKNGTLGLCAAILATGLMRFGCSFLSGILIYASYVPEGWSVWGWSLAYNGSWCGIDTAIVLVAALALSRVKILHLIPAKQAV